MRNDKVGLVHAAIAVADDVEVEGARSPMRGAHPSATLLDGLTSREQRAGLEPRLQRHHLVEVGRLLHAAERCGFLYPRHGDQAGAREGGQRRTRRRQVPCPIAQVAAQRDEGALGGGGHVPGSTAKWRAIRCRSAATSPSWRMVCSSSAWPAVASPARSARMSMSLRARAEPWATRSICALRPPTAASWLAAVSAIAAAWRPASLVVPTMSSSACAASALSSSTPATASPPRPIC